MKSVPVWTKLFTGPGRTIACPEGQGRLSVPASGILIIIPVIATAIASIYIDSLAAGFALIVAGSAVTAFLHYKFVPLIAR
ncbi:MAG: hypothetical protein ACJ72H_23955 [Candidatus Sulfotelmatobacter sp.]